MSKLVEKVKAAISETSSSFYSLPADNPEWMLHHAQARAAIAAVLEHLADNVSDEMFDAFYAVERMAGTEVRPDWRKRFAAALRAAAGTEAKP